MKKFLGTNVLEIFTPKHSKNQGAGTGKMSLCVWSLTALAEDWGSFFRTHMVVVTLFPKCLMPSFEFSGHIVHICIFRQNMPLPNTK